MKTYNYQGICFILVCFIFFMYWIFQKTALKKYLKFNETIFSLLQILGAFFGFVGLLLTILWPTYIMASDLWQILLLPFLIIQMYWQLIKKMSKERDLLDEKQLADMKNASSITLFLSIIGMIILYVAFKENRLSGLVWFPFYLFFINFIYSITTFLNYRMIYSLKS